MGSVAARCARVDSPSLDRTRTFIRRCRFFSSSVDRLNAGYRAENIPADVDVVVIGNAIKRGNPEVEATLNRKLFYLLAGSPENYFLPNGISGRYRHPRKTTTTALLAWVMEKAGHKPVTSWRHSEKPRTRRAPE